MLHTFLMFFSVLIFSQAANVVKLSNAPSLIMVFWRTLMAASLLLLIHAFFLWKNNQLSWHRIKIPKNAWPPMLFSSLTLFIHYYFWFAGIKLTTVANTATIFAVNPLFTALGAFLFFQTAIPKRFWGALTLGLLGILITFYERLHFSSTQVWGDFLVLISALLFSAYILFSKWARRSMENLHFTFWLNLFSAIFSFMAIIFLSKSDPQLHFFDYDNLNWLCFFLMALFSSILGHALFTYCLQFIDVALMSFTLLLSPLLAIIGAYYFYQEVPPKNTVEGLILILAGMSYLHFPGLVRFIKSFRNGPRI